MRRCDRGGMWIAVVADRGTTGCPWIVDQRERCGLALALDAKLPTGVFNEAACMGTLDITSQNGSAFSGRFTIACASGPSSGSVRDGQITGDGHISFRLAAEDGPDPGIPVVWAGFASCRVTDPQTYNGSLTSSNTISADRIQFVDCPEGRVQLTASFSGSHR